MNASRFLSASLAFALCAPVASAQLTSDSGFALTETHALGGLSAYGSLNDGRYVGFDGMSFDLFASEGTWQANLGTISSFMWPSFVKVDPTESYAIIGESTNGNLFKVALDGSGVTLLANLTFNYDLAFDTTPNLAYVSAGLGGWGAGNDIVRLNLTNGQTTLLAHVDGPSGPVSVSPNGDLNYITQYEGSNWPPPLGQEDLIRWDDAELDSGTQLTSADADYLLSGLDGGSSMVCDAAGNILLAHTNFAGDTNEVYHISEDGDLMDTVGTSFSHMANLELLGSGPSTFSAQQPLGMNLRVYHTDFFSFDDRVTISPARAQLTWAGPPSGIVGRGAFKLTGGEPNGYALILVASSADELATEDVIDAGWRAPLFLAVKAVDVMRRTKLRPLDATGSLKLEHLQTPAIEGQLLLQAFLYDVDITPLGTSTHAINQ